MNRQTLYIVAVVVVVVHLSLYYALNHLGTSTIGPRRAPSGKANFGAVQETYEDTTTGQKVRYREIKVSTQMADPEMVERILQERAAKAATPAAAAPAAAPAPESNSSEAPIQP